VLRSRMAFNEEAIDDLRMKLDPDGWWREFRKNRERMPKRTNRKVGLKFVQEMNAERSRRQGERTRAAVGRLWALLAHLPERERAAAIAKRLLMSARQVRRCLNCINNQD
jgi:hypothetical protein